MVLKNSKGIQREFEIILEIEHNNEEYMIYRDTLSDLMYTGKISNDKLVPVTEDELLYLNNILEKMNG